MTIAEAADRDMEHLNAIKVRASFIQERMGRALERLTELEENLVDVDAHEDDLGILADIRNALDAADGDASKIVGFAHCMGVTESTATETTWRQLFPKGRTIFYEGDDPEGFRKEIMTQFGFDPAHHPGSGTFSYDDLDKPRIPTWNEDHGWSFHCPPEHLDAIYGGNRYPMGS